MAAASQAFQVDVIKHELVHYLSAKILTTQPPWFAEGLATYYQTIEYDADAAASPSAGRRTIWLRCAQQIGVSNDREHVHREDDRRRRRDRASTPPHGSPFTT